MGSRAYLVVLLATACSDGSTYLPTPWPIDAPVLIAVIDPAGPISVQPWRPNEAIQLSLTPDQRIYALSYPAPEPEGLAFANCGVEFGTHAPLVPIPNEVRDWDLGRGAWRILPSESWPALSLSYQRCEPAPFACRNWHATVHPGPPGLGTAVSLAVVDASSVFYIVRSNSEYQLLHFDGTETRALRPPGVLGSFGSVAAFGSVVYGTSGSRQRFVLDREGTLLRIETASVGFELVAAGRNVLAAWGLGGLEPLEGQLLPLRDPLSYPPPALINESRGIAITDLAVQHWDGQQWRQAWARRPGTKLEGAGGDDQVLVVFDDAGALLILDEVSGAWKVEEALFGVGVAPRAAVGLGAGRFLMTGLTGFLGLYDGESTCQIEPPDGRDLQLAQATPDGRVIYVLGRSDGRDEQCQLLRFEVPPNAASGG